MKNIFYVYEHIRPDTGEVFYVGKGSERTRRASNFSLRGEHWKRVHAKLERRGLSIVVKFVAKGLSENEALALEVDHIAQLRAMNMPLTNKTNGGEGISGYRFSEASKANRSGENNPAKRSEARAKVSAAQRSLGEAHHKKQPEARAKFSGEGNPMKRLDVRAKKSGENSSSKRPEVRAKKSVAMLALGERHPKKSLEARNWMIENSPTKRPEVVAKANATKAWTRLQKQPYWGA
jgi:hypothetical protein